MLRLHSSAGPILFAVVLAGSGGLFATSGSTVAQQPLPKVGPPAVGPGPAARISRPATPALRAPILPRSPPPIVKMPPPPPPIIKMPPPPAAIVKRPPFPPAAIVKRPPPPPFVVTPRPPIVVRPPPPPIQRYVHRHWRPGLSWSWITVVPSLIIASELNYCHIHRYRAGGMRFHDDAECHRHSDWNHPSIRYVEAD